MSVAAGSKSAALGPWPSVQVAREFVRCLVDGQNVQPLPRVDPGALATWLEEQQLGPLAHAASRDTWPELARKLQEDVYLAAADAEIRLRRLQGVLSALSVAKIPVVLLKGAALAGFAYDEAMRRTMSDLDLWLRGEDMPAAITVLQQHGFSLVGKQERPVQLQSLGRGEVQLTDSAGGDGAGGLVELHWSPFKGWWLRRTADVEDDLVWGRSEAIYPQTSVARLMATEDMIVHLAVHLSVNHQFGLHAVRGLVDMALVAKARPVRWGLVAERANHWRVATAVWMGLDLLQKMIGAPEASGALQQLQPSRLRRSALQRLVSPRQLLAGNDLRNSKLRHLLLLLMVDRPRDMLRIVYRTIWPEGEWLAARYQNGSNRWRHLWAVLRHGQI